MIIAGIVVGSAGTLLTQLMAKAMNRSLGNVLFSSFGEGAAAAGEGVTGALKPIEPADAGVMMAFAEKVHHRSRATAWRSRRRSTRSGSCASC